jgi:phage shock protein A
MTDTTTMNGAQFRRHAGADPEMWAGAFLAAYAQAGADGVRTDADRLAFVAQWFRDAQEAAVAANWRDGLQQALATPRDKPSSFAELMATPEFQAIKRKFEERAAQADAVGRLVPPAGEQTLDARANAAKDQAAAPTQ